MIIEIKGIGIPNKGAELMLVAIIEHFQDLGINAKFVSAPQTDYEARARYGLYQLATLRLRRLDLSWLWNFVPSRLRKQYGIVLQKEVDVVLDASGFAYGDQWGVEKLKHRLTSRIRSMKNNKTKVILMPQAFGPFKKSGFANELITLADHADLICVRDSRSFSFLKDIVGTRENIVSFPDFTGIVLPASNQAHKDKDYGICFIPNSKMVEMRGDGEFYQDEMFQAVKWASDSGFKVTLLVHEGKKDKILAKDLQEKVGGNIQLLEASDPKEIKQIISRSRIVVSSRFHGLVSALSQGIPAIATGWSHKYAELMNDYQVNELMVEDFADIKNKLQWLSSSENYELIRDKLVESSSLQKQEIKRMWSHIDQVIGVNQL
ncbi:polysaccharide pyruvyl transferase family protein [Pseudidiomarina marina]|uniref:polysaccharide pyruvyl transferase family protein n=1 Tax=Pseudidiomarina marina TaxID=502366 RepID=UPI00384B1018